MRTTRLEAFSDAVLAIIITIMVLELHVPEGGEWADLTPLLPVLLSYILSFVYIGIYWNNHHHLLQTVERTSGGILWANLHLLFWLSLLPFATGWMGETHFVALPTALYGFVLLMAAIAYYLLERQIISSQGADSILAAGGRPRPQGAQPPRSPTRWRSRWPSSGCGPRSPSTSRSRRCGSYRTVGSNGSCGEAPPARWPHLRPVRPARRGDAGRRRDHRLDRPRVGRGGAPGLRGCGRGSRRRAGRPRVRRRARASHRHGPDAARSGPAGRPEPAGAPGSAHGRGPSRARPAHRRPRLGRVTVGGPDATHARGAGPGHLGIGRVPVARRRALGDRVQRPGRPDTGPAGGARVRGVRSGHRRRPPPGPAARPRGDARGVAGCRPAGDAGARRRRRGRRSARGGRSRHQRSRRPAGPARPRPLVRRSGAGGLLGRAGGSCRGAGSGRARGGRGPVRRRRARLPNRLPAGALRRRSRLPREPVPGDRERGRAPRGVHEGRCAGGVPCHRRRGPRHRRRGPARRDGPVRTARRARRPAPRGARHDGPPGARRGPRRGRSGRQRPAAVRRAVGFPGRCLRHPAGTCPVGRVAGLRGAGPGRASHWRSARTAR